MALKLLLKKRMWLAASFVWALTLYFLSSTSDTMPEVGHEIPHIDKILHFGYFFGGGIIVAGYVLLSKGSASSAWTRLLFPLLLMAATGALDEYHQTFTPGRSGNDLFDWLADVLGSASGILLANRFHPLLLKDSSPVTEIGKFKVQSSTKLL